MVNVSSIPHILSLVIREFEKTALLRAYQEMGALRRTPGPFHSLDDVAAASPGEGAGLLSISVARITLDNQFHDFTALVL
jgi:hypothetical protein